MRHSMGHLRGGKHRVYILNFSAGKRRTLYALISHSASGGRRPAGCLPGACSWTPLGDFRPQTPWLGLIWKILRVNPLPVVKSGYAYAYAERPTLPDFSNLCLCFLVARVMLWVGVISAHTLFWKHSTW